MLPSPNAPSPSSLSPEIEEISQSPTPEPKTKGAASDPSFSLARILEAEQRITTSPREEGESLLSFLGRRTYGVLIGGMTQVEIALRDGLESNQQKLESALKSGDKEAISKQKLMNALSPIPMVVIIPLAFATGTLDAFFAPNTPGRRWSASKFPDANAPGLKLDAKALQLLQQLPFGDHEDNLPLISPKGKEPAASEPASFTSRFQEKASSSSYVSLADAERSRTQDGARSR